jgi:hypothetical protein
VVATFSCIGKRINVGKEKEIYLELVRLVDKWENDNAPRVEIDNRFIDFPLVAYRKTVSNVITLVNKGT